MTAWYLHGLGLTSEVGRSCVEQDSNAEKNNNN